MVMFASLVLIFALLIPYIAEVDYKAFCMIVTQPCKTLCSNVAYWRC